MIQRQHYPLASWNGTRWVAGTVIVGKDEDRGGGPVGAMRVGVVPGWPVAAVSERPPGQKEPERLGVHRGK